MKETPDLVDDRGMVRAYNRDFKGFDFERKIHWTKYPMLVALVGIPVWSFRSRLHNTMILHMSFFICLFDKTANAWQKKKENEIRVQVRKYRFFFKNFCQDPGPLF